VEHDADTGSSVVNHDRGDQPILAEAFELQLDLRALWKGEIPDLEEHPLIRQVARMGADEAAFSVADMDRKV
jgi:hypothetical protein